MSTTQQTTTPTPVADEPKGSFWTLKRKPKDDVTEHPAFRPTLPHANLLPASVKDAISARKLRRWLILGGLLLLAIVAGIWYLQSSQIAKEEAALAKAQAENTQLKTDLDSLTGVKAMYGQITSLKDIVTTTMASQPEASVVLSQLLADAQQASGAGTAIAIGSANVAYTGIPLPGAELNKCPTPNPFNSEVTIGCLTFNATAGTREQVSEFLRVLDADPLFTGPFVTTTSVNPGDPNTRKPDEVIFSGSAGVSLEALKTTLTQEQIDAIINPPKPTPSKSPEASEAAS